MSESPIVPVPLASRSCQVQGTVTDRAGLPVRGLTVTAFDQDLRTRQQLGSARTDSGGGYLIGYSLGQFSRAEQGSADLVLEVRSPSEEVIHTTPVRFNVPERVTIDIVLETRGGEAEYDRIVREIQPLLDGQGVGFETLEENRANGDLTFVARETGIAFPRLRYFAIAQRLLALTKLPPEFWFALLATETIRPPAAQPDPEAGLAPVATSTFGVVPRTPPSAAQAGLRRAIDQAVIARRFETNIDDWMARYRELLQTEATRADAPHNVLQILNASRLPADKRTLFLGAYLEGGSRAEVLNRLRKLRGLSPKDVADVETTLAVSDLVPGDGQLLVLLRQSVDQPGKVRNVAKMSRADWLTAIDKSQTTPPEFVAGASPAEKRENYATLLVKRAGLAFPTAAFAGDLARAVASKEPRVIGQADQVLSFFEVHPAFELGTTSIDGFVKDHATPEFFNARNKDAVVQQLKAIQRVYKVAPSFAQSNTLLQDGYHSAQQIYRLGESQFVDRFADRSGFTETSARAAFQRAANTHAAVITVVGDLRATDNANDVAALANDVPALQDVPNLANLFGSADLCECEHCRSIFSPAAYLADLLMYLKARTLPAGGNARDVLLKRRPDIMYLELSCENSNTPLPMIDLACEVMEDHVAPWKLLDVPLALAPLLVAGPVDPQIRNAFATPPAPAQAITLSGTATLSAKDSLRSWVLWDGDTRYRVVQTAAALEVSLLRQTKGTAEELDANPEYVNEEAYKILKKATYPLALPFDLFTEEAREYLKRMNLRRSDVMEVFRGPNPPNNPSDLDIAAEYLGIGRNEQSLILQADPVQQGKYWGEASNAAAVAALSHVNVFLDRTGLEYVDLQRLLDLQFVNPGQAITIQHLDTSCDTDKKVLQGLGVDGVALDRIHRFLRLWRKLGWKMWEVDLVIESPGLGKGVLDAALITRLYPLLQLKDRFRGLSIEQMCAWYDDISIVSKFTKAYEKREPSLYERLFLNKRLSNPVDQAFSVAPPPLVVPLIDDHIPPITAALKANVTDLASYRALTKPGNGPAYIDGKLTRANLSFLYRHALLCKALRIKSADWIRLLFVVQQDIFTDPATTLAFVKLFERSKAAKLGIDQLVYVLTGDRSAKAAMTDRAATTLLTTLRKSLVGIAAGHDAASAPSSADDLAATITAQLQTLGWDANSSGALIDALYNRIQLRSQVTSLPTGFVFPAAITATIAINYDPKTQTVGFTGYMTDAQRLTLLNDPALAAVSGAADYQAAIASFHEAPRLLITWCRPRFRTPLAVLPSGVSFQDQLSGDLPAKVGYDTERHELTFFGIISASDRDTLSGLSPDLLYKQGVQALFNLARAVPTADELWLKVADLAFPLAPDLAADPDPGSAANVAALANLTANLKKAEIRLLEYLRRVLSEEQVFQQIGSSLGVTPAIAETLVRKYPLFGAGPRTALAGLTDSAFVGSSSAIALGDPKEQYDSLIWLHRVALILRGVKATFTDLDWVVRTHGVTGVADFAGWPVEYDPTTPLVPPLEPIIALAEFMKLNHDASTTDLSLLSVVERLSDVTYLNTDFAPDVELLTEWRAADVKALTAAGALDAAYPAAYQTISGWQRLTKAAGMMAQLNGGAGQLLLLASPDVTGDVPGTLKQILRSRNEEADWLKLSKEVQDVLRQRKCDSLKAYLLTTPQPADAPTGKWDDSNDVFACWLIDVDMCACQPSSRIVQASAAVQMFVQRCLMGLEPQARVNVNDDGWQQWAWMKYYRVWEANRRVFAYPENYAEPGLQRNKSEIFQKLEDELLQQEVNADNVESAFLHYLEGLDDVAQLEIAGSVYQDRTRTLHVIGRTAGNDPRVHYHRQFIDGNRWTGWSKIDCDIKAEYVVPLVSNERLYLIWPEFRSEPVSTQPPVQIPQPGETTAPVTSTQSTTKLFLSFTEQRNGHWTHKRTTPQPVVEADSLLLGEKNFTVIACDFTWFSGGPFLLALQGRHLLMHPMELLGCRGYPEDYWGPGLSPQITTFERDGDFLVFMKNLEIHNGDPLTPNGNLLLQQTILGLTPGSFRVSYPQSMSFFDKLRIAPVDQARLANRTDTDAEIPISLGTFSDWFYADRTRTFFVRPELAGGRVAPAGVEFFDNSTAMPTRRIFYEEYVELVQEIQGLIAAGRQADALALVTAYAKEGYQTALLFSTFYHPLTCALMKRLYRNGVEALLSRETQFLDGGLDFAATYQPTSIVDPKYPTEVVDFERDGSYSLYNWELCFYGPLMVATRLSQNQRFEDAMRWFHFIFDPTGGHDKHPVTGLPVPAPQKFWITKPFFNRQETGKDGYLEGRIENLMNLLASDPSTPASNDAIAELQDQVKGWRANPFDPHLIAQFRTVAYQKLTVMKYIDNLIAWGDQRFRLNTMESVNEATQLYVVAAELLGRRPRRVPPAVKPPVETFSELEAKLDVFSNAMVEVENLIPTMPPQGEFSGDPPPLPHILYFCIPQNDKLLGYWDTVADRLYKIRHCLDIEGVYSPRALFAPPIDPALLVRALAAGIDLSTALNDLDAPLPHYRFSTMLQKANEFVGDVRAYGAALLATLEKKDAEELALLRQSHEVALLAAVREIKKKQLDDAQLVIDGLQKSRELASIRKEFYESRQFMSPGEGAAMGLSAAALGIEASVAVGYILSGGLKLVPDFVVGAAGFGGSPTAHVKTGGQSFGTSAEDAAKTLSAVAAALDKTAALASTVAGYQRRQDDWGLQGRLATKEIEQLDKQLASASLKQEMAQKELDNHDLQIENAKAVDEFMRSKYTNKELYQWLLGQTSVIYFQSYQMALDLAKGAERCYRNEIGVSDSAFIRAGQWDSLRSGLQAGERLQLDVRGLENAYLNENRREFELTKHISLAMLNPEALVALKDKGVCLVDLPEEIYDLEYPGHYFRRIKSISLSIPCVAGPHTTVNCTLRLLKNMIRLNTEITGQYAHNDDGDGTFTDDERFRETHVRAKAFATSSGQNDSGMFELSFQDPRYLPFELAGAVCTLQLELMQERELRQFSYESISDVVLHVRYTAREDAGEFRDKAIEHLTQDILPMAGTHLPLRRVFDLKHEFPTEWYAFFHPAGGAGQVLKLSLGKQHFPFFTQKRDILLQRITLVARTDDRQKLFAQLDPPIGSLPTDGITLADLKPTDDPSAFHVGRSLNLNGQPFDETQAWELLLTKTPGNFNTLTAAEVAECYMLIEYTLG
jgi:receptor-binding and translocation channel-forming TcA subunit of Tc toxin/ABC toxin-like protein/neuraminidase-like protein